MFETMLQFTKYYIDGGWERRCLILQTFLYLWRENDGCSCATNGTET
jgi:hypothetical protein